VLPGQSPATEHGLPLLAPARQMAVLNAPLCCAACPGQNTLQLPVPAPVQQAFGVPLPVHKALSNGLLRLAVPVVSGLRATGMLPMNDAQSPDTHVAPAPAAVQHGTGCPGPVHPPAAAHVFEVAQVRLLKLPLKHFWLPVVAAGVGQSLDTPVAFFD
jgi:hypothetical protein